MACSDAAVTGNLDLLKQLREDGCPWNAWTCAYAADYGHLDILRWARKNGCPWDEWTCFNAAYNGHLETLRWAIENGCDHIDTQIDKTACVERGVFPGYGCLVAGCSDTTKSEGLCTIHKAAVYSVLEILMCNDTAKLVLEIMCAH